MTSTASTRIDIVVPAHNEEAVVRGSVETPLAHLPFESRVIVADGASSGDGCFLDTELLLPPRRNGMRIHQVPVAR